MTASVKIGRWINRRDFPPEETLVIAVPISTESSVDIVVSAAKVASETADALLAEIPGSSLYDAPHLRMGWHPAVIVHILLPRGEGVRRGYAYQRTR